MAVYKIVTIDRLGFGSLCSCRCRCSGGCCRFGSCLYRLYNTNSGLGSALYITVSAVHCEVYATATCAYRNDRHRKHTAKSSFYFIFLIEYRCYQSFRQTVNYSALCCIDSILCFASCFTLYGSDSSIISDIRLSGENMSIVLPCVLCFAIR